MQAAAEPAKLLIENIQKTFFRETDDKIVGIRVLGDISLSVSKGEFVSIIGPSGCGKSTLLRIIDGLIKADGGRVVVDGVEVDGPGPDRAVVFQYFGLYPWRSVLRNVEFGLELKGVPKHERNRIALENIARVGLRGFENHFPHELSGGMRQRVGFARSLALDPEIILMDEPFSAVDEQTREILQEQLLDLWRATRKTIVFITHSIDEAVYMADRVVVMERALGVSSRKSKLSCRGREQPQCAPPLNSESSAAMLGSCSRRRCWKPQRLSFHERRSEHCRRGRTQSS